MALWHTWAPEHREQVRRSRSRKAVSPGVRSLGRLTGEGQGLDDPGRVLGEGGCRELSQTLLPPPRSGQKPKSCCRSQKRRRKKKCPAKTLPQNPPATGFSGSRTRLGSCLGSERSCEGLSQLLGDVDT